MFIDTHTHLYLEQFNEDIEGVVQRALDNGITKMFLPNIDETSLSGMHQLVDRFPGKMFPMLGLHPCSVTKDFEQQLEFIKRQFRPNYYIAIGEIGVDMYWDKSLRKEQMLAFEQQIIWAKALKLPIVIHARDSFPEIFEVVDRQNDADLFGVFHCFSGTLTDARKILDYGGFKLGIGGVATFKNGGIDKFLNEISLEHLVLETDSPYLAPVPHRGKRNESAYIRIVAEKLSDIYGVAIEEIGRQTTASALEIFKIEQV
jgi:TatD DNase family protein